MEALVGCSGFYVAALDDDTWSSITAVGEVGTTGTNFPAGGLQRFMPFPAYGHIVAVEFLAHRSSTFTMPTGASIMVDLFRGSAGQLPLVQSLPLNGPLQYDTGASFSGKIDLNPPLRVINMGLATYSGLANLEAKQGPSQANAIYGRVKAKCGGAMTWGALIVHWEVGGRSGF